MLLPLLWPVFVLIYLEELKRMMQTPLMIDAEAQPDLARQYNVVDAITGQIIPDVVFVDTRAGLYETLERDDSGRLVVHNGKHVTCLHSRMIRLERIKQQPPASPLRYVGEQRRRRDREVALTLIEGGRGNA